MTWKILNESGATVESHDAPKAAYRAMMILSAHEIKNGRMANYRVEPMIVIPYTIEELNLPLWAKKALGV